MSTSKTLYDFVYMVYRRNPSDSAVNSEMLKLEEQARLAKKMIARQSN